MRFLPLLLIFSLSCTASEEHDPPGTEGIFVFVSASVLHACALDGEGMVWCWGAGGNGMLGNGSLANTSRAIPVSGDMRFKDVCTHYTHSCAIDTSGAAWCWGENVEGQLGISSSERQVVPARVETDTRFTRVSCGEQHTCALGEAGDVWCWGFAGLSPTGQVIRTPLPVRVEQLTGIAAIASAKHRFAVLTAQGVVQEYPWENRCDNGVMENKSRQKSSAGSPWEAVPLARHCMGDNISCGLTSEGRLYCLGRPSDFCDGCSEIPRQVSSRTFLDLDCGENTVCVIDSAGMALCFGYNHLENLAVGSAATCVESPKAVVGSHRFIQISSSLEHHCALEPGGSVWCWSNPIFDAEGNSTGEHTAVPTLVELHPDHLIAD